MIMSKVRGVGIESMLTLSIPAEMLRQCGSMAWLERVWKFVSQVVAVKSGRWGVEMDMYYLSM